LTSIELVENQGNEEFHHREEGEEGVRKTEEIKIFYHRDGKPQRKKEN
jgi:hypothetical protein